MTKQTEDKAEDKETQRETKKKKPIKKPYNNQTATVSFTLGDRAKIRWIKS